MTKSGRSGDALVASTERKSPSSFSSGDGHGAAPVGGGVLRGDNGRSSEVRVGRRG